MLTRHDFFPTNTRLAGPTLFVLVCLLSAYLFMPTRSAASRDTGLHTHDVPIQGPSIGLKEIFIEAMALAGTPYRCDGDTPDNGSDRSGLIHYVM